MGEPHAAYDGPGLLDQEFGEGATLRVAPELAVPLGSVEVWEAWASYRSLGKIILSTARAPILTTTYIPSQLKRTVTSVAQLMGSVNHGTTSAVPRSAPPSKIAHAHRRMNSAYLRIRSPLVGTG